MNGFEGVIMRPPLTIIMLTAFLIVSASAMVLADNAQGYEFPSGLNVEIEKESIIYEGDKSTLKLTVSYDDSLVNGALVTLTTSSEGTLMPASGETKSPTGVAGGASGFPVWLLAAGAAVVLLG